ncbi:MAG: methylated-DNA--[protein]-cysteine S-methyltransferase [Cyanobacteria bacterium TGS_CYA1]|nr:methylated-DNA--[protein]-cysteine S-methyltransferase [Cyanobacteria bacterium TGS_CYA1]
MISYTRFIDTPIGKILLESDGESLTGVYFPAQLKQRSRFQARPQMSVPLSCSKLFEQAQSQIEQYFKGERKSFDLAIKPNGTEFQKKVWGELCKIPFGKTISYKELAVRCGNPNASRAVGMANSKNPISLIVPCHRVIGENGSLTGYAGGLSSKEYLLKLEGAKNN